MSTSFQQNWFHLVWILQSQDICISSLGLKERKVKGRKRKGGAAAGGTGGTTGLTMAGASGLGTARGTGKEALCLSMFPGLGEVRAVPRPVPWPEAPASPLLARASSHALATWPAPTRRAHSTTAGSTGPTWPVLPAYHEPAPTGRFPAPHIKCIFLSLSFALLLPPLSQASLLHSY